MEHQHLDAIVLDLDGTIVDSMDWLIKAAVRSISKFLYAPPKIESIAQRVFRILGGIPFRIQLNIILKRCGIVASSEIKKRIIEDYVSAGREVYIRTKLFDDVIPFLEEVADEICLIVLSGATEENIKFALKHFRIQQFFEDIYSSKRKKSAVLRELGNMYGNVLYVGDTYYDFIAGKNALNGKVVIRESKYTALIPRQHRIKNLFEILERVKSIPLRQ